MSCCRYRESSCATRGHCWSRTTSSRSSGARPKPAIRGYDVILLDVDHSPRHQLDPTHADLYTVAGLSALDRHLRDDGVFALWSDDPPDEEFMRALDAVFDRTAAHVVEFDNALTGGISSNTVYVGVASQREASTLRPERIARAVVTR